MTQVLIVEDEAIVAESIASKLRRYGYVVVDTLPKENRQEIKLEKRGLM